MNTFFRLFTAVYEALLEAGVPFDGDAPEWYAEADIMLAMRAYPDTADIAVVRLRWLDQFWYVYLWRWGYEDWESYGVNEACWQCTSTSTLPLQSVNEQRLCVSCAGYTDEQVERVYQDMLAGKGVRL